MSCGKPLVVTSAGGLGHLVDEGGGLHVPVRSPSSLAKALAALLSDPERMQAMGRHNRHRAHSFMSWDRVLERLESIYGDVSGRASSRAL